MTKKKANQQSSNVKFKLKLTKKAEPVFSIEALEKQLSDLFYNQNAPKSRNVKLYTNRAGLEQFNKALKEL